MGAELLDILPEELLAVRIVDFIIILGGYLEVVVDQVVVGEKNSAYFVSSMESFVIRENLLAHSIRSNYHLM